MKKLIVTGSKGLVGHSLVNKLESSTNNIVFKTTMDLRNYENVYLAFKTIKGEDIDLSDFFVYHLAAKVRITNINEDMIDDNIRINDNVLSCCSSFNVKKVLSIASTRIYPEHIKQPYMEEDSHAKWPLYTNYGYIFEERILDVQLRILEQYNVNSIVAILTNVYGRPNDNYKLNHAHIIPDIIHQIYLAKKNKVQSILLRGTGKEKRDFIFVDDASEALMIIMENYDILPINIATGNEYEIEYIANLIAKNLEYNGKIIWTGENSGINKSINCDKIKSLGWKPKTCIEDGMNKSVEWFVKNYERIKR